MDDVAPAATTLLDADKRHLIHPLHHPKDHAQAKIFASGSGAMLRTQHGKEYIDGLSVSALWNVNIGHGRKELARAAAAQMEKLAYASAHAGFSNEPAIRLAERIVGLAYSNMAGAYFTTGGAGSNESAFKFARYYWKRMGKPDKVKIISRSYGYHGVTMAAMSATSLPGYQKMFGPMVPNFHQVVPPYPYRWPGNGDAGIGAADAVEESILAHGADTVAAIICEPVMGAGGVIVPPPTYFPGLREICDRHGVLLIADEVITGFGRTGKWFALTHWGVEPDLMSFAKGVTSGYLPLGAYSSPSASTRRSRTRRWTRSSCTRRPTQGTRKPALGMGARVVAEAGKRGLIMRQRAGGDGPPPSGDTLCLAPPLMTPEATLDRIVQIVGESVAAAA